MAYLLGGASGGVSKDFTAGEAITTDDLVYIKNELAYKMLSDKYNIKKEYDEVFRGVDFGNCTYTRTISIDENRFLIMYQDSTLYDFFAFVVDCTDKKSIKIGEVVTIAANTAATSAFDCCLIDTDLVVFTCETTTAIITSVICSISGVNLEIIDDVTDSVSNASIINLCKVDSTKALIFVKEGTNRYYKILNYNGTDTLTMGNQLALSTAIDYADIAYVEDNKIVCIESDSAVSLDAYILTVTTTVTKGSVFNIGSDDTNGLLQIISDGVLAYYISRKTGATTYLGSFDVSGATPSTLGTDKVLETTDQLYLNCFGLNNGTIVCNGYEKIRLLEYNDVSSEYEYQTSLLHMQENSVEGQGSARTSLSLNANGILYFSGGNGHDTFLKYFSFNNYKATTDTLKGQATNDAAATETVSVTLIG